MPNISQLRIVFSIFVCVAIGGVHAIAEDLGLRAPPDFEVTLYAGDDLAHDIYSMTIDRKGRIVVAGAGYVKTLHDDDRDGRADRATLFSDRPKSGAHGMIFEGDDLICTGDDGVWRFADANGDGQADDAGRVLLPNLTHKEHGANGLARGPDGKIYLVCGNDAGITEKHAVGKNSPIRKPEFGGIIRFNADGSECETVAHGFRNPYDLTFDRDGNLYTVDSDNERDYGLPWYCPTRLFTVQSGGHHGWVNRGFGWAWNRPGYFPDTVRPTAYIGRGSPTGMAVHSGKNWPARYSDAVLSACWTFGRVYCFPRGADGSPLRPDKPETFLETTGQTGFAPVDLVIADDGDLYVAIGGRHTRGSVFRVRYMGADKLASVPEVKATVRFDEEVDEKPAIVPSDKESVSRELTLQFGVFSWIKLEPREYLAHVRVIILLCGDIQPDPTDAARLPGYSFTAAGERIVAEAKKSFDFEVNLARLAQIAPYEGATSDDRNLNRELLRLFAMFRVKDDQLVARIARRFPKRCELKEHDDLFHELICLSFIGGERKPQSTKETAQALAFLHTRWHDSEPSRNWPDRAGEMFERLIKLDAAMAEEFIAVAQPRENAFLAARLPNEMKQKFARKLLAAIPKDDEGLSLEELKLVASLPRAEAVVVFRREWEHDRQRDYLAGELARDPQEEDRERLVASLASLQAGVVETASGALLKLEAKGSETEIGAAIEALRAACTAPQQKNSRRSLATLLEHWAGERFLIEEKNEALAASYEPWFAWFAKAYPAAAAKQRVGTEDPAAFARRLTEVKWEAGDASRGKLAFEKRSCAKCHAGSSPLGPSLAGAAQRFSREDLFTAIVDPQRDVAPAFQTSHIETSRGRSASGIIVYESPESTMITTAPETTLRFSNENDGAFTIRKLRTSLMPNGLLKDSSGEELADLYAYLRTLKGK